MGVQIQGDTGNVIATKGTYSGNVTIGGTLTYEDVTNIDSVGLVTARTGIEIGARPGVAASISVDGNMIVSGISTFGGDVVINDTTAAGNVHPDTKLHVKGGITFRELTSASESASPAITQWSSSGTGQDLVIGARSNSGAVLFYTGNTGTDGDWGDSVNAERLRITSGGKIGIGTSSISSLVEAGGLHATGRIRTDERFNITKDVNGTILNYDRTNVGSIFIVDNLSDNNNARMRIRNTVGSIAYNSALSDRTVKKNFESWDENVLDTFKNLNPQKFNFIREEDGTEKTKGFIAQDLADSFPEAYNKGDEENAVYYFNPSGMVVYLMKAIQELTAENAALKARLDAGGL